MNKKQKILTVLVLVGLTVTLLFFPWAGRTSGSRFAPIFDAPNGYHADLGRAFIIWLWLGAIYAGLFFVLKKSN